jgi:glycolate oxidase iron-sulfur subunit
MSAVLAGEPIDETFDSIMSSCLQCKACEVVCPAFVPFGRVMEGARAELAASRPSPGRRVRRALVGRLLASRSALRIATFGAAAIHRTKASFLVPTRLRSSMPGLRQLAFDPPSHIGRTAMPEQTPIGTVGLLAGCVMDPWFGDVNEAAIELLVAAGYAVVVPEAQSCCGALAAHDGAADDALRLAGVNVGAFAGVDLIAVTSAGCGAHLKDYGHWADEGSSVAQRTRDITELVADAIAEGRLPRLAASGVPVAMQDPCHLRHAQRVTAQPRAVVAAAGHDVVEIDPAGYCCGAAGIYSILQADMSAELGRRKAEQVHRSGATVVAAANPGCEMQLRSHVDAGIRIAHPVELYAEALRAAR